MPYTKGQSGNPKGRPPKGRALADILRKAGDKKVVGSDGKQTTRKQLLADLLWQAATERKVNFSRDPESIEGNVMLIENPMDWFTIGKFVHQHLDGPVRPEIDIAGSGVITFNLSVRDTPVEADEDDGEEAEGD